MMTIAESARSGVLNLLVFAYHKRSIKIKKAPTYIPMVFYSDWVPPNHTCSKVQIKCYK